MFKKLECYTRIQKIEFENFRNIEKGAIEFPNSSAEEFIAGDSSILGLYGQNGSGKTSVIMALSLLKRILSGGFIDEKYNSCIKEGEDRCTLRFTLAMCEHGIDGKGNELFGQDNAPVFYVYYDFDIVKISKDNEDLFEEKIFSLQIENEVLKIKRVSPAPILQKQAFFDTRQAESDDKGIAFGPKNKHDFFVLDDDNMAKKLRELKIAAKVQAKSFIFSKETIDLLVEKCAYLYEEGFKEFPEEFREQIERAQTMDQMVLLCQEAAPEDKNLFLFIDTYSILLMILESLKGFGKRFLYVIDTAITASGNFKSAESTEVPILIWNRGENGKVTNFKIELKMDEPNSIREERFEKMRKAVLAVSDVLNKVVPGVELEFKDLGSSISKENKIYHYYTILSKRGDTIIPLQYESDGIRRFVSILSLLIAVYNEPSFTIAIDEIDAGIFEYLLGEIMGVMSESVKGQLIFTSHNLRPLEVLPAKYLCFTTTNPNNRFTKLPKRGNSNLRDCYFRNIVLGGEKESIYMPTDRYDIELALYKAGHTEG